MTEKTENVSRKYNFSPLEMRLDKETGKVRGQGKRKKPIFLESGGETKL